MAQWTVALVACSEPLADAGDVELVLAVLAWHAWQTLVGWVEDTVADEAVLNAVDLLVDVGFPEENGRDDVSIPDLEEILDGEHPFALLSLCDSELLTEFHGDRPQRVVGRNLNLQLHRNLSLGIFGNDFLR